MRKELKNDFPFDDKLSRLVEKYEPSELSLDELDNVFAAGNQPDFSKFLDKLNENKK